MDILNLNPDALDTTAFIIEQYCRTQIEIMDSFLNSAYMVSNEWVDDKTIGKLINEIKQLKSNVEGVMGEIILDFPKFFRAKAEAIRNRPEM